jgi:hypothetical protein
MIRGIFKFFMWLFVASFVFVAFQSIRNPMPKMPEPTPQQAAANMRDAKDGKSIMEKAYVVGREMARAGAIKPNAQQMDALSRMAQTKAGDTRSRRWFKQYFEAGFWEGWKSH